MDRNISESQRISAALFNLFNFAGIYIVFCVNFCGTPPIAKF